MSEDTAWKCLEMMPDKAVKDFRLETSVSRESSFSSIELGASVSRNSSFSSYASSSGGSIFEHSSSCPASRSSSWRSNDDNSDIQRILSTTEQQYRRLEHARAKIRKGSNKGRNSASSRHGSETSVETYHTLPESRPNIITPSVKRPEVHGRSCSESEALLPIANHSKLSSPGGLVISTPPMKSFMEYRLRSRSFNGAEQSSEGIRHEVQAVIDLPGLRLRSKNSKEELNSLDDCSGENKEAKELVKLRQERDDLRRDRDRVQCELNAVRVERDALLREKEEMQRELNNRDAIIHHLQDHVNLSVKSLVVTDELRPPSMRQRSKSEVHRPAFYIPDEIAKTNAYTCL